MEVKKNNGLAIVILVLSVVGLALTFFIGWLGAIISVVTLIFSCIKFKSKNVLYYISLGISILSLIIFVVILILGFFIINSVFDSIKNEAYEHEEYLFEYYVEMEVYDGNIAEPRNNESKIITADELKRISNYFEFTQDCDGYVIITNDDYDIEYDAYITCDKYKSEGFKSSYLK